MENKDELFNQYEEDLKRLRKVFRVVDKIIDRIYYIVALAVITGLADFVYHFIRNKLK